LPTIVLPPPVRRIPCPDQPVIDSSRMVEPAPPAAMVNPAEPPIGAAGLT